MNQEIETHPFDPFIPQHANILIMGTFPPKSGRWSMDFYYPNRINDFWRVMGCVFYDNKDRFVDEAAKSFRLNDIKDFLEERGIAMSDTGYRVRRLRDNASDKYLEIVEPVDLEGLLSLMPGCNVIATTGEKAAKEVEKLTGLTMPKVGECVEGISTSGRKLTVFRMPSTSRAYPLPLEKKAEIYGLMFKQIGLL